MSEPSNTRLDDKQASQLCQFDAALGHRVPSVGRPLCKPLGPLQETCKLLEYHRDLLLESCRMMELMTNEFAAIEVSELSKSYRNGIFRTKFEALKAITLRIERGEVFGLLGPNGAGKTTLIKILLGIVRKSAGSALLLGRPAGDRRSRVRVGYLPENLRIATHHTARTAMDFYGKLSGLSRSEILANRDRLLESVGLADRAKESIKRYSKGMLQRLGLAQALLHDPDLLILDEPTDGLDPHGRSHVRNLLSQLKSRGKTVFLNSHILQEVELICDRVAILDRGILKAVGPVETITPRDSAGIQLELQIAGDEQAIRAALGDRGVNRWERDSAGHHRLVMRLLDQNAVDQCVDDLRRSQVSIVGLSRSRVSLEDAFLQLLSSEDPG
jgi:ABC-2 type transport system ATP-binding protein